MKQRFADFFISRNFSLLWLGQALSSFGEFVFESTVIVWLVTDLYRDSASLLGTLMASQTLNLAQAVASQPRLFSDIYGAHIVGAACLLLMGAGLMLRGQVRARGGK